jgi:hypothetical protein
MESIVPTVETNPEAWAELRALGSAHWPKERARALEASRLSGQEVVYSLTMFDIDWSPIFMFPAEEPIAWRNARTGERRDGAEFPDEGKAPLSNPTPTAARKDP